MQNKIAIDASNIHYGGAFQVTISFIEEFVRSGNNASNISLILSTAISDTLKDLKVSLEQFSNVVVMDTHLDVFSVCRLWRVISRFDLVFTVFGPYYGPKMPGTHIQGFGQAWILRASDTRRGNSTLDISFTQLIKYKIQKYCFLKADVLVVESERTFEKMRLDKSFRNIDIRVVHNAISHHYINSEVLPDNESMSLSEINGNRRRLKIGLMARDYPHKNIDYLVDVRNILEKKYELIVELIVTLTEDEWRQRSASFRAAVVNAGVVSIADGPAFYKQLDIVLFPSLLETFSATPIEALAMQKPLFASDREFVRDFCKNYACYIDPLDPNDGAARIFDYANEKLHSCEEGLRLATASEYVRGRYAPEKRMRSYIQLIEQYNSTD